MSGQSLTTYHSGPAIITYRGQTFLSQSGYTLNWSIETFPVVVDNYQEVDQRLRHVPTKITFTPPGIWSAPQLAVLFYLTTLPYGDYVTPVRRLGAIASNQVTISKHLLLSGDSVFVTNTGGALPTGLAASTRYYVHAVDANTLTFHSTYSQGVSGASPLTISGGTGKNALVVNNICTIQSADGALYTFSNAAVTKMPDLNLTVGATPFDSVEISFFPQDGVPLTTSGSIYTITQQAYPGDGGLDPATVLTQSPTVAWGGAAPWNAFNTKNGVKVKLAASFDPIEVDGQPILTQRFLGLKVSATAQPVGPDAGDLPAALLIQGAGASIGRSLGATGNDLVMSATGQTVTLSQAALTGGPEQWSVKKELIGELTWVGTRKFISGVPVPLITIA